MTHPLMMIPSTAQVGELIDVEPIHCHQRRPENTLVESLVLLSPDGRRVSVKFRFVPNELPFFFDHEIDHLPGMLEINAMRQAALAMAHVIYGVPTTWAALLGWLKVRFYSYAELKSDTTADIELIESELSSSMQEFILSGVMLQGESRLLRVDGQLVMMHPRLARRIRRKEKVKDGHVDEPQSAAFHW